MILSKREFLMPREFFGDYPGIELKNLLIQKSSAECFSTEDFIIFSILPIH